MLSIVTLVSGIFLLKFQIMKITAFKTNKPRQFNYRPLFYDKKKDEMEQRLKELNAEVSASSEELRGKIRDTWRKKDNRTRSLSKRTLYIYLAGVIFIIYFVFFR